MRVESRLKELGIVLPEPPPAVAAYVPWVRHGSMVVTSGQLPWQEDKLAYAGRLGEQLDVQQGYEAARICAVNALAQLKAAVGDLDCVVCIVRVEGNVHSAPDFRGQPQVLNGASDLLNEVFGHRGQHTRTALGISAMPLDAPVQLSVWAEVADGPLDEQRIKSRIVHFTVATRDVAGSADFFEATLGWRPIGRPGNMQQAGAWLSIGGDQELHLVEVADFEPSTFEREFGRHLAVSYPREQLAGLRTRLVEHGAELISPVRETPFERFFFRDPNGYVFEVVAADHQPEAG